MAKWEYMVIEGNIKREEINILGEVGWELVTVLMASGYREYYFKRPLDSQK